MIPVLVHHNPQKGSSDSSHAVEIWVSLTLGNETLKHVPKRSLCWLPGLTEMSWWKWAWWWKPVGSLAPALLEFSSCTCSATLKLFFFGKWFIWQLTKIIVQHFRLCCLSHLESYLHNGKNSFLNKEKGRDCQSSSDKCFRYELGCKCLWRCWASLFGCWLTRLFLFLPLLFSSKSWRGHLNKEGTSQAQMF